MAYPDDLIPSTEWGTNDTVPVPVTSSIMNSRIVQRFNQISSRLATTGGQTQYLQAVISPTADAAHTTDLSYGLWLQLGSLTVPPWATRCRVTCCVDSFYDVTGGPNIINLAAQLGTVIGGPCRTIGAGLNVRVNNQTWQDLLLGVIPGVRAFTIQAQYVTGSTSGTFRADATSRASMTADFLP